MIELKPAPGWHWFQGLPKVAQWPIGGLIILMALATTAQSVKRREPGEPVLAIYITLIILLVVLVLTEVLRPKPNLENARPLGLGDFQFPTATEGRVVPLLFGRVMIKGPNVVWYGDLRQDAITETISTGFFSKSKVTRGFRYFLGVQFAICRGPDVALKRVLVDEIEIFNGNITTNTFFSVDELEIFGGDDFGNGGLQATIDFYVGSTTQPVSAYLDTAARQRVTTALTPTAPRYTGTCHLVVREFTNAAPTAATRGAYLGNSTSLTPWAFEAERFPPIFSGQAGGENKIGASDCNPMNVVYELLTNTEWGFGFAASEIDVGIGSSFLAAADTMITEANGFAMIVDRSMRASELLNEIQRQIDGVVFLDSFTGLWTIKLARFDYNINLVPQLTDSNVKEVRDFTRGAWEDTTNQVQVRYDKRDDEYKESYALAQDMANAIIIAGGSTLEPVATTANVSYPGVKLSALASNLAWRDLRGHAYPLARATFVVNREGYTLKIADVFAWTNVELGFVKLAMRITRIDYGRLEDNQMTISAVQDVFGFANASMGTPPSTSWNPPVVALVEFPAADIFAIEAPRALITRDPEFSGDPNVSKVWAAARRQGGEVAFEIGQRNAAGAPSGAFFFAGNVVSFMRIGQLDAALGTGTTIPSAVITINATPDGQTALEEVFDDTTTLNNMGANLAQMILVNDEFMLVQSASINGADVDLENVYRGVLDTVQGEHLINDEVFLVFVGAGLTDTSFPLTNQVDIELRMRSASAVFAGAIASPINFTMAKRTLRPYPPAAVLYNGNASVYGAPDLEGDGGAGENTFGFDVDWRRRDLDTLDELAALLADNPNVSASTEYRLRVFVDPDGANDEVITSVFATGSGPVRADRLPIINKAAAGTEIRVQIETRHDFLTETNLTSRNQLFHDIVPTSVLSSLFYLGGDLRANVSSNGYTSVATGTFTIRIGAAYSTSDVEVDIDGGGFVVEILAGGTSGTFSVTSGEVITVRHTVNETPSPQFVELENPSATRVAYGVMTN